MKIRKRKKYRTGKFYQNTAKCGEGKRKTDKNRRIKAAVGGLRRLPNLIGPGGDSKRLQVSWRQAALAEGELQLW